MQELSISLPAIGNAISDVYDMLYGTGAESGEHKRALDVKWYSPLQQHYIENGDYSLGGKTRDLSTLAGTINTLHDRLGQIIVVNTEDNSLPSA